MAAVADPHLAPAPATSFAELMMRDVLTPLHETDSARPGHLGLVDEPARYVRGATVHVVYAMRACGPSMTMTAAGELDSAGALELQAAWAGAVDGFRGNVCLDLRDVSFAISAGLHALAGIRKGCHDRGWPLEVSVSGLLDRSLRLPGVSATVEEPGAPPLVGPLWRTPSSQTPVRAGTSPPTWWGGAGRPPARTCPTTVAAVLEVARRFLPAADSAILHLTGVGPTRQSMTGPLGTGLATLEDQLRQRIARPPARGCWATWMYPMSRIELQGRRGEDPLLKSALVLAPTGQGKNGAGGPAAPRDTGTSPP